MLVDFVSGSRVFVNDEGVFYSVPRAQFRILVSRDKIDNLLDLNGFDASTHNIYCDGQTGSNLDSAYIIDRNVERNESIMYSYKKSARAYTGHSNGERHLYFWCLGNMYDIYVKGVAVHITDDYEMMFWDTPTLYFKYICRSKGDNKFYLSFIVEVGRNRMYYILEFSEQDAILYETTACNTEHRYEQKSIIQGKLMDFNVFMRASLLGAYWSLSV